MSNTCCPPEPIPCGLNFAPGVLVAILLSNGVSLFVGELVGYEQGFLQVRLTVATGPYLVGQVVRINVNYIAAIA